MARLNRRLRQERQTDLTPTQLSVLGAVRTLGPSTPSAIAVHERVQPPSITRVLTCLVDDGLALREPHPDDAVLAVATPAPQPDGTPTVRTFLGRRRSPVTVLRD